jgi:hypothetical protein
VNVAKRELHLIEEQGSAQDQDCHGPAVQQQIC